MASGDLSRADAEKRVEREIPPTSIKETEPILVTPHTFALWRRSVLSTCQHHFLPSLDCGPLKLRASPVPVLWTNTWSPSYSGGNL
jgi:hypothetical protein